MCVCVVSVWSKSRNRANLSDVQGGERKSIDLERTIQILSISRQRKTNSPFRRQKPKYSGRKVGLGSIKQKRRFYRKTIKIIISISFHYANVEIEIGDSHESYIGYGNETGNWDVNEGLGKTK